MSDYRYDGYNNYDNRQPADNRYGSRRSASSAGSASGYYGQTSRSADRSPRRSSEDVPRGRVSNESAYARSRYTQNDRRNQENRTASASRRGERTVIDERRNRGGSSSRNAQAATSGHYDEYGRENYSGRSTRGSQGNHDARNARSAAYSENSRNGARDSRAARESVRDGRRGQTPRNLGANKAEGRGAYNDLSRYLDSPKKGFNPIMIAVPVLAVLLIAFGIFQIVNPKTYDITINGAVHTVERGTTIETVLEAGYATPVAGNLLAVDGAVLQQGGGDRFSAVVNDGEPTNDATTPLKKNTVVVISDGADIMEPYTETTETIPYEQVEDQNYWNGSMHVYIKGVDGVRATRTGEYSGVTITEDTTPVVNNHYRIYNADTKGDKVIALTFDDGPWAGTTEAILDILKQYNVKATFFTVGYRVADYADLIKRMHDEGHQICTHTWDHASGDGNSVDLTLMKPEDQITEVEQGIEAIEDVLGIEASRVIRAPGGNFHGSIVWTLQPYITAEIGWDIDTQDWRRPGVDAIANEILKAQAGDVVLMHDGGGDRSQTVEALKIALPKLIEQGYTFVTVDEMLAYGIPGSEATTA